jgi:hypothetical protein
MRLFVNCKTKCISWLKSRRDEICKLAGMIAIVLPKFGCCAVAGAEGVLKSAPFFCTWGVGNEGFNGDNGAL